MTGITNNHKVYLISEVEDTTGIGSRIIPRTLEHLSYALRFNPDWVTMPSMNFRTLHLEFYALSSGWGLITNAGYKSHFFHAELTTVLSDEDVMAVFMELLNESSFSSEDSKQTDLFACF